jgi:hypothetical protein
MCPPLRQCLLSTHQQWNKSTDADTATDGDWTGAYPAEIIVYAYATIFAMSMLTILFSNSRKCHVCIHNKFLCCVVGFNYQHNASTSLLCVILPLGSSFLFFHTLPILSVLFSALTVSWYTVLMTL